MADLGSPTKKALSAEAFAAANATEVVDEEARRRRGTVSDEQRQEIQRRAREGRANVSLGSATKRALDRSRSEASVFGPASSGGSRFQSGIDTYQAVLANSPIRAGPRDNELQPMWEQDKELEGVRTLSRGTMNLAGGLSASSTMTEGMLEDGFSTDELVDFGRTSPGKRSREEAHALVPLAEDEHEDTDVEDDDAMDEDGRASPSPAPRDGRVIRPLSARRGLQATQSVPVIGAFGSRAGRAEDFKMDADF